MNQFQQLLDAFGYNLASIAAQAHTEGDVTRDSHMWPESVILEDHAQVAFFDRHFALTIVNYPVANLYPTTFRCDQTSDHAQNGCLATAGWSQQRKNLPLFHSEIDVRDDPP